MPGLHHLSLHNSTGIGQRTTITLDGKPLQALSVDLHIEPGNIVTATVTLPVTVDADVRALLMEPDPSINAKIATLDVGPDDKLVIGFPQRLPAAESARIAEIVSARWPELHGRVLITDGAATVSVLHQELLPCADGCEYAGTDHTFCVTTD